MRHQIEIKHKSTNIIVQDNLLVSPSSESSSIAVQDGMRSKHSEHAQPQTSHAPSPLNIYLEYCPTLNISVKPGRWCHDAPDILV